MAEQKSEHGCIILVSSDGKHAALLRDEKRGVADSVSECFESTDDVSAEDQAFRYAKELSSKGAEPKLKERVVKLIRDESVERERRQKEKQEKAEREAQEQKQREATALHK